jgi:tetratricopeptide (TPR) repeat protein
MPDPGRCSQCGARLPDQDFFAVLRHCDAGPICFIFSARPNVPGVTHAELTNGTGAVRTTQLPFQAAPVLLSRQLSEDLKTPRAAAAEIEEAFGEPAADHYSGMLEELALLESDNRSADLIQLLGDVRDVNRFQAVLGENPELLGDELLDYLERIGSVEDFRASLEILTRLLREARTDPVRAWQRYEQTLSAQQPTGDRLEEAVEEVERLIRDERWEEAIATAGPALEQAQGAGLGIVSGILHSQIGIAFLQNTAGDRRRDLEQAIEHIEKASQLAPSRKIRANQLVNLAAAFGQRVDGDPNENFEDALRLLERAAEQIDQEREPRAWATLQTNLCRSLQVRESGDKVENLERALRHAEAALATRSPEADAHDWAMSQINLGVSLQLLAEQGARDPGEARAAFGTVLGERDRLRPWMVAQTLANLAELERAADDHDAAVETLREAVGLIDPTERRLLHGRLLNHLSDSLSKLGRRDEAVTACEEALGSITPQSAPVECQQVAARLGGLRVEAEEWKAAADAYRIAMAAADLTFHSRLHVRGRRDEMRRQGNTARWASYAVAKAGQAQEAVEILESGRARELRRRIHGEETVDAELEGLPDDLGERFIAVTNLLRSTQLGDDSSGSARALHEILEEIRRYPGFEDFGKAPGWEKIAAAAEPGYPLIYLNPTPAGTVMLCLEASGDGTVAVEPIFRATPQGTDVAAAMLAGGNLERPSGHSYIGTACGITPDRDLGLALETLLPWLGAEFGRPIAERLRATGATGATLVPCGILGLAPVHVGTWEEAGRKRSLVEEFNIRYAASASIQGVAVARRQLTIDVSPHLVALGNPVGADLDAAEGEVREIASRFSGGSSEVMVGAEATSEFLLDRAAEATHLHLACHASGAAFDLARSSIVLSDRGVAAAELAAVGPLQARLTVASACQTAISEIGDLPEEALSIGTALVGAGSACVIATLWSVDDYATGLLMTRLYEELAEGLEPPAALRRAQLWLAELDASAEAEWLDSHPHLKDAFARRDLSRQPLLAPSLLGTVRCGRRLAGPTSCRLLPVSDACEGRLLRQRPSVCRNQRSFA